MSPVQTLRDIVRDDLPVLTPDMPIRRAVALLIEERGAAGAVLDEGGVLQGILSQKDCFRPALNASYYQEWKGTVADFMTVDVMTLSATADIATAAEAFLNHPHRVFPVLDGEQFVGMLRRSDLLRVLVGLS